MLDLLGRPDARVVALGGGALGSERVRDALRGHTVVHLQIGADEAWRRASGKGRPLARDRNQLRAAQARPEAVYESRRVRVAAADAARRRAPRGARCSRRSSRRRPGRGSPGRRRLGRLPGLLRARAVGSGFFHPRGRPPLRRDRRERRSRSTRSPSRRELAVPPGEQQKTLGHAEERAALPRVVGRGARRHPHRRRRRRGGRPRRLLRVGLPARHALGRDPDDRSSPRSTPPTAGRRASICRRRRTTSARSTSPPPCWSTRRCSRRCLRRRRRRAMPRWSRPR